MRLRVCELRLATGLVDSDPFRCYLYGNKHVQSFAATR